MGHLYMFSSVLIFWRISCTQTYNNHTFHFLEGVSQCLYYCLLGMIRICWTLQLFPIHWFDFGGIEESIQDHTQNASNMYNLCT